jgi:hypothetical protein
MGHMYMALFFITKTYEITSCSYNIKWWNTLYNVIHLKIYSVTVRSNITCVPTLWRRFSTARLLSLWVWIPPGAWKFVCWRYCVLIGIDLCDELITCLVNPTICHALLCVIKKPLELGGPGLLGAVAPKNKTKQNFKRVTKPHPPTHNHTQRIQAAGKQPAFI